MYSSSNGSSSYSSSAGILKPFLAYDLAGDVFSVFGKLSLMSTVLLGDVAYDSLPPSALLAFGTSAGFFLSLCSISSSIKFLSVLNESSAACYGTGTSFLPDLSKF
jgi:hypothetical protein